MSQASFAIDIAAKFAGGDQTISELDAIASKLTSGGKDAAFFGEAMDQINAQLMAASAASATASAALADGSDRYRALEKAAIASAKAAEKAALKHGGVIPPEMAAAANAAKSALEAETVTLRKLEQAAEDAAREQDRLTGTSKALAKIQGHVGKKLGDAASRTAALQGALGDLGGPLGSVGQAVLAPIKGFADLSEKFSVAAAGAAVAAAAIVIVVAAVVALGVAALAAGIGLADTARKAALSKEAFLAMNPALAGTVAGFGEISDATGLTADQLTALTKKLQAAKVSAEDMPAALRAAATAEAALGSGGADQFIADINEAKGAVGGLAAEVQNKLGGIVSRQILGLEAQGNRLKGNVSRLFSGLDIEPLLLGVSKLVGLFDESSASGKAMQLIFETVFQPLVDALADAAIMAEAFFLGLLIGATKVYIWLKPAIKAIKELFGFDGETSIDTLQAFTAAGKILAVALAAAVGAFTIFVGLAVASAAIFMAPIAAIVALGVAIYNIGDWLPEVWKSVVDGTTAIKNTIVETFDSVIEFLGSLDPAAILSAALLGMVTAVAGAAGPLVAAVVAWWPQITGAVSAGWASVKAAVTGGVESVKTYLTSIDLSEIGNQIMAGLAKGITGGAGKVVDSISGAVTGAIGKAKSLLGIASPSKVFAEIGGFTGEGFTGGVEQAAPQAQEALQDMVAPPKVPAFDAPTMPDVEAGRTQVDERLVAGVLPEIAAPNIAANDNAQAVDVQESGVRIAVTEAQSPADRFTSQPAAPTPPAQTEPQGGGVSLENVQFIFNGVEGAEDGETRFRETLIRVLEGDLTQAGGKAA